MGKDCRTRKLLGKRTLGSLPVNHWSVKIFHPKKPKNHATWALKTGSGSMECASDFPTNNAGG
jgi:hypothetical protein